MSQILHTWKNSELIRSVFSLKVLKYLVFINRLGHCLLVA